MTEPLYITDNDTPPEDIDFSNVNFTPILGQYQFKNYRGVVINLQDQSLPKGVM
jgi:hypothetical protein